ncbi:hypothetical protein LTR08_008115 [Meristemomyces frigidus]|nr:hypothetical protein LTR08_008115 [Meristemomyces frigidus]
MIASLGAGAVLDYNAVRSPLAQPRNMVIGQTVSAIIGVSIAKLFQLSPTLFANYAWLAGAFGCACASWIMSVTNTVHPPGGATAVLASTEAQIVALGWMFVPFILLGSVLMLAVALLFNNTLRQYPEYWWTPADVGHKLRAVRRAKTEPEAENGLEKKTSSTESERTLRQELDNIDFVEGLEDIHILAYRIRMPSHLDLTQDEVTLLEKLQERIRTHGEVGG